MNKITDNITKTCKKYEEFLMKLMKINSITIFTLIIACAYSLYASDHDYRQRRILPPQMQSLMFYTAPPIAPPQHHNYATAVAPQWIPHTVPKLVNRSEGRYMRAIRPTIRRSFHPYAPQNHSTECSLALLEFTKQPIQEIVPAETPKTLPDDKTTRNEQIAKLLDIFAKNKLNNQDGEKATHEIKNKRRHASIIALKNIYSLMKDSEEDFWLLNCIGSDYEERYKVTRSNEIKRMKNLIDSVERKLKDPQYKWNDLSEEQVQQLRNSINILSASLKRRIAKKRAMRNKASPLPINSSDKKPDHMLPYSDIETTRAMQGLFDAVDEESTKLKHSNL